MRKLPAALLCLLLLAGCGPAPEPTPTPASGPWAYETVWCSFTAPADWKVKDTIDHDDKNIHFTYFSSAAEPKLWAAYIYSGPSDSVPEREDVERMAKGNHQVDQVTLEQRYVGMTTALIAFYDTGEERGFECSVGGPSTFSVNVPSDSDYDLNAVLDTLLADFSDTFTPTAGGTVVNDEIRGRLLGDWLLEEDGSRLSIGEDGTCTWYQGEDTYTRGACVLTKGDRSRGGDPVYMKDGAAFYTLTMRNETSVSGGAETEPGEALTTLVFSVSGGDWSQIQVSRPGTQFHSAAVPA